MEPYTFTTIQFLIARRVADALDTKAIAERARENGVERTRFEMSTISVPPGKTRVTCQRLIAPFIIEGMQLLIERAQGDFVFEIAAAVKAALDALAPPK